MIQKTREFLSNVSTTKKTILRNTIWLSLAEIGSRIARGGLGIVAARMLGVSGLGVFSYAIALGGFLTFFEDAGIATFVTRSFAKNEHDKHIIFGTALVLKIILGVVALLFFIGIGPLVSTIPASRVIIPVIAFLMFCDALRALFFSITRAEQRMHVDAKVQIITNTLIVIFGISFMMVSPTPLSLAWGYALGSFIGTSIMFFVIRNYLPNIRKTFSRKLLNEIFFAAWPFTVLAISNVLIFNTDTLFLGYYGTTTDVGLYAAASRIVQMFYILASLFATSTFPTLVQKTQDQSDIMSAIRKSLILMLVLAVPLMTIMILGSVPIMNILFGYSFVVGAPILTILALSYIPVFILSILNNVVLALDKQKQFVIANIVGVVVNIALDVLLIPHYQGVGAAIASVVGLTTITLITGFKLRNHLFRN
ncbi:MAG: flippase [bacterium]